MEAVLDDDADRAGEAGGLLQPRGGVPPIPLAGIGKGNDRASAAREFVVTVAIEDAQAPDSASSPDRSRGRSG
jgi:hypothetical protein